jgi:type I restriction enzyme M protein
MGIVLPHGVLFRGGTEGTIRQKLLENGSIYAVIGLPANMFYNTGIPTCIIVLKKQRPGRDVLFIDASRLFEKKKTQNVMNAEHIARVLELYENRTDVEKEAHLAAYEEIKENDFNLNIPRYVDATEKEPPVRLSDVNAELKELNAGIAETSGELKAMLGKLRTEDEEMAAAVREFMDLLEGV